MQKAMQMNPYYDLAAVRSPSMFFGRTSILRRIYSSVYNHQCLSLVGPRHIGKSSVLNCARQPGIYQQYGYNLDRHILAFIDLREFYQKTTDAFFASVSKQIIQQSQGHLQPIVQPRKGPDGFSELLDDIEDQGLHLTLLMDAFDNIIHHKSYFDLGFFGFLRAQASIGRVSYITASIIPLNEVRTDIQGSPFFNIFSECRIGPLDIDDARDLILKPSLQAGVPFSKEEADWVLLQTGRHPFFIQRFCYHLFEEKLLATADMQRDRIRHQAYNELVPHFEDAWHNLNDKQQELLKNEAQQRISSNRQIPELSESALFRKFVRDKYQLQLFHMTVEDVEAALEIINDTRLLGESKLKHLKIASIPSNQHTAPSLIEQGQAIRKALHQALERLRGNGIRRDGAVDWRHYNILYYRYFQYYLKNDQISARLEFTSIRQYYRERAKALEALFNAILDMETSIHRVQED
jgi:hypothetical protein